MIPDGNGKRYRTFDSYAKERFGCKVVKIPLDGGFTCPNRDGTKGTGGCAFCAGGGAECARFSAAVQGTREVLPLRVQYEQGRAGLEGKWGRAKTVASFQSYTSTYAPLLRLRALYEEALSFEDVVGLTVATRADALSVDILNYLEELTTRTALTVELGLQSVFDETARRIGRGHTYGAFLEAYEGLKKRGIRICVHLIDGLPGEDRAMMLESARRVSALRPGEIKFHNLYIRRDAVLFAEYAAGRLPLLSREEYVSILADQIALLDDSIVVSRVTGDPDREALAAPAWAADKKKTLALLDKTLSERGIYQGVCANYTK